ncbi:MAG: hypothetical protein ACLT98_17995 [Eggerthellaceae bacterium]
MLVNLFVGMIVRRLLAASTTTSVMRKQMSIHSTYCVMPNDPDPNTKAESKECCR